MKDIIRLAGMSFYGYHGVSRGEKETGRMFEVDCELEVDLSLPGESDSLKDTVDYTKIYALIKETLETKDFSLLEGIANELTVKLLDKFPIEGVTLKVRKLTPPIAGHIKHIEVEFTRYKKDLK